MSKDVVSMNVPEQVIASIVERTVAAEVVKALGDGDGKNALIEKIVTAAFRLRVDSLGKPSTYSSAKPFLEHHIQEAVRQAAIEALAEYMEEYKGAVKKEVKRQLQQSNEAIVEAMYAAVHKAATNAYHLKVNFEAEKT